MRISQERYSQRFAGTVVDEFRRCDHQERRALQEIRRYLYERAGDKGLAETGVRDYILRRGRHRESLYLQSDSEGPDLQRGVQRGSVQCQFRG